MSYDVEVYAQRAMTARELVKTVKGDRELTAKGDRATGGVGEVEWKRSGEHCFNVDGPMEVDSDEIPEEWTGSTPPTVFYSIQVPYIVDTSAGFSFEADPRQLSAALGFASRLAERLDGLVVDLQT